MAKKKEPEQVQPPSPIEAQQTFLEKMDEFIGAVNRLADAVLQHLEWQRESKP
jgi:hypothetical protein